MPIFYPHPRIKYGASPDPLPSRARGLTLHINIVIYLSSDSFFRLSVYLIFRVISFFCFRHDSGVNSSGISCLRGQQVRHESSAKMPLFGTFAAIFVSSSDGRRSQIVKVLGSGKESCGTPGVALWWLYATLHPTPDRSMPKCRSGLSPALRSD